MGAVGLCSLPLELWTLSNLEVSLLSLHLISKLHEKRGVRHQSNFNLANSSRNSTTDCFVKVSVLNRVIEHYTAISEQQIQLMALKVIGKSLNWPKSRPITLHAILHTMPCKIISEEPSSISHFSSEFVLANTWSLFLLDFLHTYLLKELFWTKIMER